jgi:hypothetical protein
MSVACSFGMSDVQPGPEGYGNMSSTVPPLFRGGMLGFPKPELLVLVPVALPLGLYLAIRILR